MAGFLRAGEWEGVVCLVTLVKDISGQTQPWLQLGSVIEDLTLAGLQCLGCCAGAPSQACWTPVRKLLWCCSGVQPSAGIGVAPTHRGW